MFFSLGFVLILVLSSFVTARRNCSKLFRVDGPWLACRSSIWMIYHSVLGQLPVAIEHATRKYGPRVRIGPNIVVATEPDDVKQIYRCMPRGSWHKGMKMGVLGLTDAADHRRRRRDVKEGYSGGNNERLEAIVDAQVEALITHIDARYVQGGSPCDLRVVAFGLAMDVLTALAVGEPLGCLTHNEARFGFHQIEPGQRWMAIIMDLRATFPRFDRLLEVPWLAACIRRAVDGTHYGALFQHIHQMVRDRCVSAAQGQTEDMLASFMRHGLDVQQLCDEVSLALVAGTDPVATTLQHCIWNVVNSPAVQQSLREEITAATTAGRVSQPVVTAAEARQLKYLQAVLTESIRKDMPLVGLASRVFRASQTSLSSETSGLDDLILPEGCELAVGTYAMLRRPDIFGRDATKFRPERWFGQDEKQSQRMTSCVELAFAHRDESCPGKSLATTQVSKALTSLLANYDIVRADGGSDVRTSFHGVVLHGPMMVRFLRKNVDGGDHHKRGSTSSG